MQNTNTDSLHQAAPQTSDVHGEAGRGAADRELLELAAKAAGIPVIFWHLDSGRAQAWLSSSMANTVPTVWNPLEDDGDALRLAVKLAPLDSMLIAIYEDRTLVGCRKSELGVSMHDGDPSAATRRAIVRAAAEIARSALAAATDSKGAV